MNPIAELKHNLLQKRKQGQQVISVKYVLDKLKEWETDDTPSESVEGTL